MHAKTNSQTSLFGQRLNKGASPPLPSGDQGGKFLKFCELPQKTSKNTEQKRKKKQEEKHVQKIKQRKKKVLLNAILTFASSSATNDKGTIRLDEFYLLDLHRIQDRKTPLRRTAWRLRAAEISVCCEVLQFYTACMGVCSHSRSTVRWDTRAALAQQVQRTKKNSQQGRCDSQNNVLSTRVVVVVVEGEGEREEEG